MTIAICLLPRLASAQTPPPIPYGDNPAAGKFYDLHGFRIYTEVYGSGPPLLMIHGNNGSIDRLFPQRPLPIKTFSGDSRRQPLAG